MSIGIDRQIRAEREAQDQRALVGKPSSETGRLGNRLISLAAQIGVFGPAKDDSIRREMASIRERLDAIHNSHELAAE